MFGSKKSAGKTPWAIQILTTEYLIQGSLQADELFAQSSMAMSGGGMDAFERVRLTDAHIRPTGILTTPEQSFAEWELPAVDNIVAIIPLDAASQQAAQKAYKDFRHPMEVVLLAGPFLIRAKLLSDKADGRKSPFAMTQILPLTEAEINCQLAGAKLTGFRAPWMLLNGQAVGHGFGFV